MNTKEKVLKHFEELISLGESVRESIPDHPLDFGNLPLLSEWRTRVLSLFGSVLPKGSPVLKWANGQVFRYHEEQAFEELQGSLCGVFADFKAGWFENLKNQVESEVSVDLLGQAEQLMSEKEDRSFSYIPAAVLAGAVLEKNLRSLCESNEPTIHTTKPNGQPKSMNALIDDLKKAEVLDEIWAKQLKAWAGIRNAAAHGKTDEINSGLVQTMIGGIPEFLRQFMK